MLLVSWMAKKYLIYIHRSDLFDALRKRGQKSQLVNTLLERYWKAHKNM